MTTYLVYAQDARGAWLDVDARREGYPTQIEGAGEMLAFVNTTRTGVLHDWDGETHTNRRIAYWTIYVGGIMREVYITSWGRHCRVEVATPAGCRVPVDVPPLP